MRALLLTLALLTGCYCGSPPITYPLRTTSQRVAVASRQGLVTVSHGLLRLGDPCQVQIRGLWRDCKVSKVDGEVIWIEAADGDGLDLRRGDSGSPVVVGLVTGSRDK